MTSSYAVVFKTYSWDGFVERQARRCQAAAGSGDFYISIDETNGTVGPVPFDRVVRTNNADLIALGFADRYEKRALLWWNPDYVHYQFQELYPKYDYYVFVEYDAAIQGDLDSIVDRVAALNADFVALPLDTSSDKYFWTLPHRQVYSLEEIKAALMCISIYSPRALKMLAERRRSMAADSQTRYWPIGEVYLATEIGRAGYNAHSLEEFGDTSRYLWFPPILEDDIPKSTASAFLHPILDKKRFIQSVINNNMYFRSFLYWKSSMYQKLARFPKRDYYPYLPAAARLRVKVSLQEKRKRFWLHATLSR